MIVRADHGFAPQFEGIRVSAADRLSAIRRFIGHDWCEFDPNPRFCGTGTRFSAYSLPGGHSRVMETVQQELLNVTLAVSPLRPFISYILMIHPHWIDKN
jgi:hypothetical protein